MRTFIAIEIPEDIRSRVADFQSELKRCTASVSWVKPANIHVTLKFLGEVTEERIAEVFRAVEDTAVNTSPFSIGVAHHGVFPDERRPRVLWVGVNEGKENLKTISHSIEERLAAIGFPKEKRPFSPHLTIGRVKSAAGIHRMVQTMKAMAFDGGVFMSKEIVVMKSDLQPSGAVYTPLKILPFRMVAL